MDDVPKLGPRSEGRKAPPRPAHTEGWPTVLRRPPQRATGVVIGLTGGNVRNNHIYLRGHECFFPPDALGGPSEKDGLGALLTLHFEGLPEPVRTDIARDKLIFRNRRAVGRFFTLHSLGEGDSIIIDRISEYEYRIRPSR
jgi:hypothetical protein